MDRWLMHVTGSYSEAIESSKWFYAKNYDLFQVKQLIALVC